MPTWGVRMFLSLEFTNGSIIYFRPAGAYGDSFRSLHVDRIWVDEGAWLTERAWKALRQCLKAGGTLRIYSTPNGMRGHHLLPAHQLDPVPGLPLALLVESHLDRRARGGARGVLRRQGQRGLAARGGGRARQALLRRVQCRVSQPVPPGRHRVPEVRGHRRGAERPARPRRPPTTGWRCCST